MAVKIVITILLLLDRPVIVIYEYNQIIIKLLKLIRSNFKYDPVLLAQQNKLIVKR